MAKYTYIDENGNEAIIIFIPDDGRVSNSEK